MRFLNGWGATLSLTLILALFTCTTAAGQIMVAVEDGSAGGSGADIVTQLNDDTFFDFEAVLVTADMIDEPGELAMYHAVVFGQSGNGTTDHDWTQAMADALVAWVDAGLGGVVSAGWADYAITASTPMGAELDEVMPIDAYPDSTNYYCDTNLLVDIDETMPHPVTDGVADFLTLSDNTEFSPFAPDATNGAVLGTTTGDNCSGGPDYNAIVVGEYGLGNIVYLGMLYGADLGYNLADLRTGSADQLLEQAVAWVASCDATDPDGDGVSECDGDCEPAEPTAYPGAVEIANDGLDNDCDGVVDNCVAVDTVLADNLGLAIVDAGYDGTLGSMSCVTLNVPNVGDGIDWVTSVELTLDMEHTWVGDLTYKLQGPSGTITTLMSRPGLAETVDGAGQCCGTSTNLFSGFPITFADDGTTDAELLGSFGTDACAGDTFCDYFPNPGFGPGTNLADFQGEWPYGDWNFCVGDGAGGDLGFINSVELTVLRLSPFTEETYWADTDGDGYGDPAAEIQHCGPLSGYVQDNTDCDDTDSSVYPGAIEDPTSPFVPDMKDNDCDGVADEGLIFEGDLLITEIMKNPDMVTDGNGEWVEVLNDSIFDLNLLGLELSDDTATDVIDIDVIVLAGDYVIFGRNGDFATNGGVDVDFDWTGLALANNAADLFAISHFDGMDAPLMLDTVAFDDATFPDTAGAAMQLNITQYDVLANDDGANWCDAYTPYGDGDLGTPALDNDLCCVDLDGDGYGTDGFGGCPGGVDVDCNDNDPMIYPGADEYCNGYDDDCDAVIDEAEAVDAVDWCDDADGDGFGDPASCVHQCNAPGGTVGNNLDCDDTAVAINPNATEVCDEIDNNCDGSIDEGWPTWTWWPDADGDGYGEIGGASITTCMVPGGYADNETDCDDTDAAVNPAATEVCDSVDNDCDGTVDVGAVDAVTYHADTDNDGYGDAADSMEACSQPSGYVVDDTDCDDTDPLVFPGANEQCNGVDDDCDGTVDDGITYVDYYPDTDGDAFGDINGTPINDCVAPVGYVDNNGDCDDTDDTINPLAIETCDGVDEDCDGTIDDGLTFLDYYPDADSDTYGDASAVATSACDPPTGMVEDNTDCDDTNDAINPDADEVCDGVDNDCDGTVDEDDATDAATWYEDADGDGYGDNAVTTVACDAPTGYVADNTDCDDTAAAINPGANEVCNNGVDDDCDATTDETTDEDGDGLSECDGDCDDSDADVNPSAIEVCDGVDNDCNPATDEDVDDDGDLETECEGDCNDANAAVYSTATEICDGLDNDCDGSMGIDEVDADGDGSFLCDVPPDCDDADVLTYPGAPEQCDNLDNDCDGIIDEDTGVDQDGDGFTPCTGDCDDTDAAVNPAAKVELCDGKDTDCDGITPADEVDADMDTYLACEECDDANPALNNNDADMDGASTCDGDCDDTDPNLNIADGDADGDTTCDGDCDDTDAALNLDDNDLDGFSTCTGDCDDTDATANPDATEICDSGVDNDCDGVADDVDADMDGFIDDDCGGDDCDDADDGVNPDADEICDDTIDNDCDGDVDGDDVDCGDDDDSGDDDSGDDDSGDDDSGDDDDGDDDTGDDDTDNGGDCECNSDVAGTPVAPAGVLLTLLTLALIRRRAP